MCLLQIVNEEIHPSDLSISPSIHLFITYTIYLKGLQEAGASPAWLKVEHSGQVNNL